jgi:SpoVK/Ycf46/Vps4 family AAA+-type ATPase
MNMLDGVEKLDNVVLIATTNYPENSRPGSSTGRPEDPSAHAANGMSTGRPSTPNTESFMAACLQVPGSGRADYLFCVPPGWR